MADERRSKRVLNADAAIIQALDDVKQRLDKTIDLITKLSENMAESRRHSVTAFAGESTARTAADAGFLPRTGVEVAGEDESVLREMARSHGLEMPMERLIILRNDRYADSRPRYWGIVNFDLHSAKRRLFVFDVTGRRVASYLCAHGKGSEGDEDDGIADVFLNKSGSKASSLGIYRCAETYHGENGYSLKLDGLETTNSNARSRFIVMHGADYVSEEFAERHSRIGRSEGCPALDHQHARTVINQLKLGSLLIHWKTP